MNIFAKRVRELRTSYNQTQKHIAYSIEMSERSYIDLENSKYFPSYENLIKLADYFNVSLDYLAGRSDKQEINK